MLFNPYSLFLHQLKCGTDEYLGRKLSCQYNSTHQGVCSVDCIPGLEDSSKLCGCNGPLGLQCPNSPVYVRCCLDPCSSELKLDLGIIIDVDDIIDTENYQLESNFTKDLLRRVNVGPNQTHVVIINYSDSPEILTRLDEDYDIQKKLDKVDQAIYYKDGATTVSALQQAALIFFTC